MSESCFMCHQDMYIGRHGTLFLRQNDFPIRALHCLLLAPEHREDLCLDDIKSAASFARAFAPNFLVYHNMCGAGATRPEHLHCQVFFRDHALPIEEASRRELLRLPKNTLVSRVEEYPVYSLAVAGEGAVEITFAILQQLSPTPFNLVLNGCAVFIVPRKQERPSPWNIAFGGLELAGCLVVVNQEQYQRLTYDEIQQGIAQCGWTSEQGKDFEQKIFALFG